MEDSTRAVGLGDCTFLHAIFLKRSKIDTSQNVKVSFATKLGERRARASWQERGSHQKVRGRKRVRPERLKKPASKWKDVDIQPSQEFSQKRGRHSSYCGKIPRMRKGGLWVAERKLGP